MNRLALVSLVVMGCVRPDLPTCGDSTCPPGTQCVSDLEICASQAAVAACTGSASGTLCSVGDIDGSCEASMDVDGGEVCVGEVCGDGKVTGREQCDGGIGSASCITQGFYVGTLTCSASCLFDVDGCTGRCGDGIVQSPIEDCDGSPPDLTCVGRGFDYGHLACTIRCTDTSLTDCGDLTPKVLFGATLGTTGASLVSAFIAPDISVFASADGLTVFEEGVETDFSSVSNIHQIIGVRVAMNTVIYIANANDVDELTGDAQHLALLPVAPTPPFAAGNGVSGLAADSHGTLYAVAADCEWATFDGTQWSLQPTPVPSASGNCAPPRPIVVSQMDEVYAGDTTGTVWYLTSSGWTPVIGGASGHLNPSGPDGHALLVGAASGTKSGIYELAGANANAIQIEPPAQGWPQNWADAIAIQHPGSTPPTYEYIALNVSGAWWLAPNAPPIIVGTWKELGTNIGLMPDGHVVTWGTSASSLTPMAASPIGLGGSSTAAYAGARAYGSSFIGWTNSMTSTNQVVDVLTSTAAYFTTASEQIIDVSVFGTDIYVATNAATYHVPVPGTQVMQCSFSGSETPVSIAGTGGTNGYVATWDPMTDTSAIRQFSGTVITAQCGTITPPPGRIEALAASPTGELYAAVFSTGQLGVLHLNTQNGAWEPLHAFADFQAHDLAVLPDGTIVLCGQDHIAIGVTTNGQLAWQDLDTGARHVSGTSATDIWFTEAVARASVMAGLAQWNGSDLAPVNEITNSLSNWVAASPDVVVLGNVNDIYAMLRFAMP